MKEKENLVLLCGLSCDERLWEHQAKNLSEFANIFIPDLTKQESISQMADDVLSQAPEKFCLAGMSMGGYVAFEIYRKSPKRIKKLALLDTSSSADSEEKQKMRKGAIKSVELGKFEMVTKTGIKQLVAKERRDDKELISKAVNMALEVGKQTYINQQKAILNRKDSTQTLKEINCKTLVICGEKDEATPPRAMKKISENIKNSQFMLIKDCGHLSPIEAPETVTSNLEKWLKN